MARVFKRALNGAPYQKWSVELRDHLGVVRKFTGFSDKRASEELAAKLERLVAYRAARRTLDADLSAWLEAASPALVERLTGIGLIDGQTSASAKPLAVVQKRKAQRSAKMVLDVTGGHLLDYRRYMEARELAPQHITQVITHIAKLFVGQKLTFPSDITASAIETYITTLRQGDSSARTANAALAAIKSFCGWMVKQGYLASNPAARIGPLNERADRRVIRRAFTVG